MTLAFFNGSLMESLTLASSKGAFDPKLITRILTPQYLPTSGHFLSSHVFGFKIIFIQIPPALHRINLFSSLLHSKRLAKNPLFEVISLLVPTGPPISPSNQLFLEDLCRAIIERMLTKNG